ncbi:MAG TPA: carbamoyltransferase C-terminal domain-containing protein [Chloroflexia bacterium]|jgi:carbamoyltransferase
MDLKFWSRLSPNDDIIVGLTPAHTQNGEELIDGGACCIAGDRICAVAEERLTRKKHAGGSEFALSAVLKECGVQLKDVTHFYVSTCGEPIPLREAAITLSADGLHRLADIGTRPDKVRWLPSHHLSHAYASFETSGLSRALVLVLDDSGSASYTPTDGVGRFKGRWNSTSELERASCFVADRISGYTLVKQVHALAPFAGSYGTMYRYVTDFLGLSGLTECGKTMALAAYGDSSRFSKLQLMGCGIDGDVTCLQGAPEQSVQSVRDLIKASGYTNVAPCRTKSALKQVHKDLAARAQEELENAVVSMVRHLVDLLGVPDICLSGGVGLNCVLAGKLLMLPEVRSIFVTAAPGDTGQPLGNCLYGVRQQGWPIPEQVRTAFLGPSYSSERIRKACETWGCGLHVQRGNIPQRVANALASGKIVAVFHGRSELGPRALGHRSILADPRGAATRDYLNSMVKHREDYRPYGLSVLSEAVEQLVGRQVTSSYMMVALPLFPAWQSRLPAVSHVDGSSRIQTVSMKDSQWFRAILEAFEALTGIPGILNTSFNDAGEPIVETPEDAMLAFTKMEIDALAIEDWYLEKPPI